VRPWRSNPRRGTSRRGGIRPAAYTRLQVHFTGKRLDGTWFASTREDGVPLTFILGQ
uniref:Rotamase n=1 Tax=Oryza glaberrima TaxID=4538 RepID=I1NP31_ORYGL